MMVFRKDRSLKDIDALSLGDLASDTPIPPPRRTPFGLDATTLYPTADATKFRVVESRRRKLSPGEYTRLKQSVLDQGVFSPITVEQGPDGLMDIISGSNRYSILAEAKRPIPYHLVKLKSDSEQAAFMSNLLQPELGTAEVYFGLKVLLTGSGLSQADIASKTGLSKGYISKLLSMDALGPKVLSAMKEFRLKVGADTAHSLVKHFKKDGMRPQTLEQYQESLAAYIQAKGQLLFESEVLEGGSPEQVSKYWTSAVQDWLAEAKRKSGQRGAGGSKLPALSGFFKKLEAVSIQAKKAEIVIGFASEEQAQAVLKKLTDEGFFDKS